jgi:hypothetical protein
MWPAGSAPLVLFQFAVVWQPLQLLGAFMLALV